MRILVFLSLLLATAASAQYYTYPSTGGGDVHWKAPVASTAALPASGNTVDDVRFTADTFTQFVWNGSSWQTPGGVIATPLSSANIIVGNASNVAAAVTMTGDTSITNAGLVTVVTVGGSTAANIHTAEGLANAATALNTASQIMKRDGSGQVAATTFTGALAGNASTATALAATPSACGSNTFADAIAANGNLTCTSIPNAATTAVSTNTNSAIVTRDGSGNFSAGTITATITGHSSLDLPLTGGVMSGAITGASGSSAAPAYTGPSTGTGVWFPGTDQFQINNAGVQSFAINATNQVQVGSAPYANATFDPGNPLVVRSTDYQIQLQGASNTATTALTMDNSTASGYFEMAFRGTGGAGARLYNNHYWSAGGQDIARMTTVGGSANTNLATTLNLDSAFAAQNNNTTVNNYECQYFYNNWEATSAVCGVNTVQGSGTSSGKIAFVTENAGTRTEQVDINANGTVRMYAYGIGISHFDSSGNITSSAIVNADLSGTAGITSSNLANTTVTPGTYTLATVQINAQGQVVSASSGSAGTVSSTTGFEPESWELNGMLSGQGPIQDVGGTKMAENSKTLQKIRVCASDFQNGGGVVVIKAHYGTAKVSSTAVTLTVAASSTGATTCAAALPAAAMVTNDQMDWDFVSATGTAENLTVKFIF